MHTPPRKSHGKTDEARACERARYLTRYTARCERERGGGCTGGERERKKETERESEAERERLSSEVSLSERSVCLCLCQEREMPFRKRERCLCKRETETARERDLFLSRWLPRRVVIPQDLSCSSLERRRSARARDFHREGNAERGHALSRIEALWAGVCEGRVRLAETR